MNLKNLKDKRTLKYGGFSVAITLLVIVAILALNVLFTFIENNNGLKIDFTPTSSYSLDSNAQVAVRDLDKDVVIYTFIPAGQTSKYSGLTKNIVEMFDGASDKITSKNIDPVVNKSEIDKFSTDTKSLSAFSVVVAEKGNETGNFHAFNESEMYEYNENTQKNYFVLQRWITSALIYIRTGIMQNVYFLTGHGEDTTSEDITIMKNRIQRENFNVEDFSLANSKLQQGDILVLLQATSDLTKDEYNKIISFIDDSFGRVLVVANKFVDDTGAQLKNYNNLLSYYNIIINNGVVADASHRATDSNKHVQLIADTTHEISAAVRSANQPIYALEATSFDYSYGNEMSLGEYTETFTPILMSYSSAVLASWENSALIDTTMYSNATQNVACAFERINTAKTGTTATTTSRILLFGSTDIAASDYLGNSNILRNGINWLAGKTTSDEIVSVGIDLTASYILMSQSQMQIWFACLVVALPILLVVIGIVVWIRRKNL